MSPGTGGRPSRFLSPFDGPPPAAIDASSNDRSLRGSGDGPRGDGFRAIGPFGSEHRAREAALVLTSMSIEHALHHASSLQSVELGESGLAAAYGFYLLVRERDFVRAKRSLDRYEEENRDWPPRRTRERLRYGGIPLLALAFAALVVFAWFTGPAKDDGRFFVEGTSVSSLVLSHEPFRAVTALTLHGDGAHVMGNLLSGALFGRAVERRLGPGLGGLGVLAAGALGNYANAAYYGWIKHTEHLSIGASTAVLGAVGILASTQMLMRTDAGPRRWYDVAAPIVGGLALLGTIGSSRESDLGAHGFGFAAGLAIGAVIALAVRHRKTGMKTQLVSGALALGVVGGAWALALAR